MNVKTKSVPCAIQPKVNGWNYGNLAFNPFNHLVTIGLFDRIAINNVRMRDL